ncbi:cytochrome c-type biogenesis protein [Rhabdothermincola salaria]|uniref:cytochrome c-type biogenesis protein n=1 Tax=Rhabdothermincola salaria TaxID=2903142 RepID=UPI001E3C576D|nr:cytochrome c-type biogenesis protein CcmH [Rhabdothermincola salaria]
MSSVTQPPPSPFAPGSPVRRWLPWAVLFVVVVSLLAFGSQGTTGEMTAQDRVTDLARTVACPSCGGESVADSNHPSSQEIRRDMALRIEQGQSDDEIRAYLVSRFGEETLLTPPSSGVGALVWVIPVVAVVIALTALVIVFRRWQHDPTARAATDADRALVADALRHRHPDDVHGEGSSR